MSSTSYRDLLKQRAALNEQIEQVFANERVEAIAQCVELIERYSLEPHELTPTKTKKRKVSTIEPRYRDPATGQTWTGRGKQPRWIVGPREAFLIAQAGERDGPDQSTALAA